MIKKKFSKKYNIPINIFSKGGEAWKNAISLDNLGGTIGSIGGAASSIIGAGVSNAKIADTTGLESNIDTTKSYIVGSNDFDSLMGEWSSNKAIDNVNWRDIRGGSTGQRIGNTLGAAVSGASAGAKVGGPWGAVVGAVAGIGSGIAGWITGDKKAKNKAEELNKDIDIANEQKLASLIERAQNIDTQNDLLAMSNYMAKGGKIYIKPSKRGTFTKAAEDRGLGVQEFANKVLANKEDYSTAMVKKANFARNAKKWKHDIGGYLFENGGSLDHQHGGIFTNDVIIIGNGGTHEQNPFEGVQIGVDAQGIPNMVEEGEVIWDDYVFSNRLKPTKEFKDKYKVKGDTFADVAKNIQKESEERPNDPISKKGLEDSMSKLIIEQENMRTKSNKGTNKNLFNTGGTTKKDNILIGNEIQDSLISPILDSNMLKEDMKYIPYPTYNGDQNNTTDNMLRYAPVVGSGIGAIASLFDKPDYSNANLIMDAADKAGQFIPIRPTYLSNYLSYKPLDRNYYLNKLNAQAGATRRAIANTAGGNRATAMAGLLAADYNTQDKYGDLIRQAEEYDLSQRQAVEQFNRGTNQANAEIALQSARYNQAARQAANEARLKGIAQAVALREDEDNRISSNRSLNLTNLFDNLGAVGKEKTMINMLNNNPALLYEVITGKYKGSNISSKGGYLTIKNKRRK